MGDNEYDASSMIQDYAPCHEDMAEDDCLIKTVNNPVAVHVFTRRVVIVSNDGTVLTFIRR